MEELSRRLENERDHGRRLLRGGAEETWNWSSPAGERRARRRAGFLARRLQPGLEALELGCGTGLFTRLVAASGASIVATDLSEALLDTAQKATVAANIRFEVADAHALHFQGRSFDVVFGSSVLHHLQLDLALREIHRVLRPGGIMVFAEPNMLNPQIWAERNIPWVRQRAGVSPDETAFVRFSLEREMRHAGYVHIAITPHEFLHPATPEALCPFVEGVTRVLEHLPLVREIAGSLLIEATKPQSAVPACP
ncbi:MAG: methyltransferase domain-containing protein [Thermoanaerobaculaceae bacterium]|nr:methyltransferase domain-containing protein [Thermoanaerobaculaceae bacterium]